MATEQEKQELIGKLEALVQERFDGDYKAAFDNYANKRSQSGSVDADELSDLLKDAGVGNAFTRGFWVDGVMAEVDKTTTALSHIPSFSRSYNRRYNASTTATRSASSEDR